MSCLAIRIATARDLPKVQALLAETWHDTYDTLLGAGQVTETISRWHALDVLEQQVTLPGASFLLALLGSEVVGHACALERGAGVLVLSRLYVLPAHQRQGLGGRLFAAILERHPGAARVQLVVEARNAKGRAFYGHHGFVVVEEIEEEGSKSLRMERLIPVA